MSDSETQSNPDFNLENFLPFRLHQASEAVSQSFRSVYRNEFGMTRSEWRVLAHLGQYGALTATEIGNSASLHKTKVSRAVYTLEKRRWLIRAPDERDRRVQILNLTKFGQQAYQRLGCKAQSYNDQLAKQLGPVQVAEIIQLANALQRITQSE